MEALAQPHSVQESLVRSSLEGSGCPNAFKEKAGSMV